MPSLRVGTHPSGGGVVAIIVTFQPDPVALSRLLNVLCEQAEHVLLVDNGSSPDLLGRALETVTVSPSEQILLGENKGVAAAQNVGLRRALALGARYAILFDQDSLPEPGMVARLVAVAEQIQRAGQRLASIGPRYVDVRQDNPPPFIRIRHGCVERCRCDRDTDVVEVDYLISSGCLISTDALRVVGMMQEALFIDYVDIDWCLRAKAAGYRSFGCCGARMTHQLGDVPIRFLGRDYPARSPLRHYYMMRNAMYLYRYSEHPLGWKFADGKRLMLRLMFYALLARPRSVHLKMMLRGLSDGWRKNMGPWSG